MNWFQKVLLKLLGSVAPAAVAYLLAQVDPETLANNVKPHLKEALSGLPAEWKKQVSVALKKLSDFVAELAKE